VGPGAGADAFRLSLEFGAGTPSAGIAEAPDTDGLAQPLPAQGPAQNLALSPLAVPA